ncbi:MAG TPA: hypothetical protein VFE91_03035 [Nitrososphaerales archaeon]|nr:hypothetical protein [Nitrososphaerales archaeon]
MTPFTKNLVEALAVTLTNLMTGQEIEPPASIKPALEAGLQGLEALYTKGRLSEEEFAKHRTSLEEWIRSVR